MPASLQVFSQVGLFFENGTNNPIISRNNTANLVLSIPIRNELKKRLNLYYKKTRCSLMSLMYLGMPSLCLLFSLSKIRYNGGSFFVKRELILTVGNYGNGVSQFILAELYQFI